jgi:hypothetical protein
MNIFGYDLQEGVVFIIRIIATIGGAVVGWFVCDPLTRVTYRISFRAATPGALLFCGKAIGGASLAAAVWFFMPTGDGSGGPGFGEGKGGLPGKGADKGGEKPDPAKDAKVVKDKTEAKDKSTQSLEPVEIEIISGKVFEKLSDEEQARKRYFLIKRAEPPLSADELEAYLKKHHARIEVTPVLTKESFGIGRKDNPRDQLLALTKKYDVKTLQEKIVDFPPRP